MKRFALLTGLFAVALPLLAGAAMDGQVMKTESGWFDFENCAFCKHLTADPGLLEHATWETHAIDDGMMTIMTVESEYAAAMAKAEQAMNELGMKIQKGEVDPMGLKMCGHCQAFGLMMMGGQVKMEEVRGDAAVVSLTTSDDPGVVQQLQQMAKRNRDEHARMMGGHEDHSGHGQH